MVTNFDSDSFCFLHCINRRMDFKFDKISRTLDAGCQRASDYGLLLPLSRFCEGLTANGLLGFGREPFPLNIVHVPNCSRIRMRTIDSGPMGIWFFCLIWGQKYFYGHTL